MPYRPGLFAILLAPPAMASTALSPHQGTAVGCRCDPYREYNLKGH